MTVKDLEYVKILIEKGKFIFIVSNKDFTTEAVNPYFTELTGYRPEEIIGKKSTEVLDPPEIQEKVEGILKELETKGKFQINENPIVTKNGEVRHILWHNVWDEKNEKHISIGIDITELRKTEEELRKKDECLLNLTSEAGAYIWRTLITEDGKEKTIYYTDSIENILGYPKEFFLDRDFIFHKDAPFRKIVHPDDLPSFEKQAEEAIKNRQPLRQEIRIVKENGEIAWIYEYFRPIIENGKLREILGIGIDITENKKKQLEIEEKNRELEFLLNIINAYIFKVIFYPDGTYKTLFYSDGIKNVTGYDKEEFFSGKVKWEDIVYPADRGLHRREVEEKALEGIPGYVEYRIRRKDGRLIWVLDSIQPVPRKDGAVEVVGVCIDINERKRLEEERKVLEKLQTVGFIAGSMSHIFNNILTGILGYTSLMKLRVSPTSSEYSMLSHIEDGIERMVEINNRLLAYARLGKYKNEKLDLVFTLKEVLKEYKEIAEVKGIDLKVEFLSKLCKVKGDENQLRMLFRILMEDFMERVDQGNWIKITTTSSKITKKGEEAPHIIPGRYIKIVIQDNGPEISEKELRGIFEPTTSDDAVFFDKNLNFPAAYGVVKSHEGFIYIESKKGKGTKLTIYLPCAK